MLLLDKEEIDLVLAHRNKKRDFILRPLKSYSDDEKCGFFDDMYNKALDHLKIVETYNDRVSYEHIRSYMFEDIMQLLAQPGLGHKAFWDYYNDMLSKNNNKQNR